MKNPAAFISYARRDDAAYGGRITGLRQRLQQLVASAIGREFEIFQDCEGIAWGQHWRSRLHEAIEEALFLIPILTPSYFNSQACRAELATFLELERRSGRNDRILPLYFLHAPVFEQSGDPLAEIVRERQYRDWRHLRIDPVSSVKVMRALDGLAKEIADSIHTRVLSPPSVPKPEETIVSGSGSYVDAPRKMTKLLRHGEVVFEPRGRLLASKLVDLLKPGIILRDIDAPWCPELVVIPAGRFLMGSPDEEEERYENEGPQHEVRFARPFALGRYPVTFEEYDHFCAETGREQPPDQGWGRGRRPAINVSWDDAQAYCAWLGQLTGQPYRLPSEAEWEYACRAGTTTPFWTGPTISTEQANYDGNHAYGPGRKGEHRKQTRPVDTFPANPWGLHDMHGNVWEWCQDCSNRSADLIKASGRPAAPTGRMDGGSQDHPAITSRKPLQGGRRPWMITRLGDVTTPLHLCWLHLFNHQTHHRGQVHDQLSQTEVPPPPLDLIVYIRERESFF